MFFYYCFYLTILLLRSYYQYYYFLFLTIFPKFALHLFKIVVINVSIRHKNTPSQITQFQINNSLIRLAKQISSCCAIFHMIINFNATVG